MPDNNAQGRFSVMMPHSIIQELDEYTQKIQANTPDEKISRSAIISDAVTAYLAAHDETPLRPETIKIYEACRDMGRKPGRSETMALCRTIDAILNSVAADAHKQGYLEGYTNASPSFVPTN